MERLRDSGNRNEGRETFHCCKQSGGFLGKPEKGGFFTQSNQDSLIGPSFRRAPCQLPNKTQTHASKPSVALAMEPTKRQAALAKPRRTIPSASLRLGRAVKPK